jgi:hypothetical protein
VRAASARLVAARALVAAPETAYDAVAAVVTAWRRDGVDDVKPCTHADAVAIIAALPLPDVAAACANVLTGEGVLRDGPPARALRRAAARAADAIAQARGEVAWDKAGAPVVLSEGPMVRQRRCAEALLRAVERAVASLHHYDGSPYLVPVLFAEGGRTPEEADAEYALQKAQQPSFAGIEGPTEGADEPLRAAWAAAVTDRGAVTLAKAVNIEKLAMAAARAVRAEHGREEHGLVRNVELGGYDVRSRAAARRVALAIAQSAPSH